MRALILSDIHYGDASQRSPYDLAINALQELIPVFNEKKYDVVLNLGDIVTRGPLDLSLVRATNVISTLYGLNPPLINLLGNHDIDSFPAMSLRKIYHSFGLNSDPFGALVIDGIKIIWADMLLDSSTGEVRNVFPKDRLPWLELELAEFIPKLLITHCPIVPQDPTGSLYWENSYDGKLSFINSSEVAEIIRRSKNVICINGHAHWIGSFISEDIKMLTCPSFSDNIAAPNAAGNHPMIFTELETYGRSVVLRSFSRDFMFGNAQISF